VLPVCVKVDHMLHVSVKVNIVYNICVKV